MTILGFDVWVIVVTFSFVAGMFFQKETAKVGRIMLKHERMRKELSQRMRRVQQRKLAKRKSYELPPAYKEENWQRNVHGEPTDENYILASTGCELTDAIYAAAQKANIDIVEFEQEFDKQKQDAI